MSGGNGDAPVPFVLPGPAIARETAAGWARWRTTRHSFTPAPRLTATQYRRLSVRARTLHDLHRAATHANLAIQETPMSAAVARVMFSRIQNNALKHKPTTRAGCQTAPKVPTCLVLSGVERADGPG